MFILEIVLAYSIIFPLLAVTTRGDAQRQQNEGAAAAGPSARDNNDDAAAPLVNRTSALENEILDMRAQLEQFKEVRAEMEEMKRQLTATKLTMAESEFSKMTPTSYGGPPYLKDKATFPTDIFVAAMACHQMMHHLIEAKEGISPDDPALDKVLLLSAKMSRLSASYIGGIVAAQSIENKLVGPFVDQYYLADRPNQIKDPRDSDGDIDNKN